MEFLFPNLLYFLFALGIPIIIHLFNFRRYKRIEFTNVRLLKDIELSTKSTRQLRNLLILLARLLALTFIVMAFAQPFIPAPSAKSDAFQRNVLIYVDNSFSMDEGSMNNRLLDAAKESATEIVNSHGEGKSFFLFTNEIRSSDVTAKSAEEALHSIDEITIHWQSRSLDNILNRMGQVSLESEAGSTVYLISDFQKSQFDFSSARIDTGLHMNLVLLESSESSNFSIDSCFFVNPVMSLDGIDTLMVQYTNFSDQNLTDHPIRLFINDQQKSLQTVDVEAWSRGEMHFPIQEKEFGTYHAKIASVDQGLPHDDQKHLTFRKDSALMVYHIGTDPSMSFFETLYSNSFQYKFSDEKNVDLGQLAKSDVLILNPSSEVSGGLLSEIKSKVEAGNSLILYSTEKDDFAEMNVILDLFELERIQEYDTSKMNVSVINTRSEIMRQVIEKMPENANVPYSTGTFKLAEKNRLIKEDILSFENNRAALRSYAYGKGKVYLYCFPLRDEWTNYLRHPLFVPVSINIAYTSETKRPLYYHLTNENMIETNLDSDQDEMLHVTGKQVDFIPEMKRSGQKTYLYLHDQLEEAGIYSIEKNKKEVDRIALNYNGRESDIRRWTKEELSAYSDLFGNANFSLVSGNASTISERIRGQHEANMLWKYCIILALVFLMAEVLILKLMKS